jgi:predicted phosphodiesterase
MSFSFDLISDLHIESWPGFDWSGQPTSAYCVVAGDVARDPDLVAKTLTHLGECYAGVFYIDGNEEHRYKLTDLSTSYQELCSAISDIPNVIYMQNNVVITNGVALLATNGWWTYEFDPATDVDQSIEWYRNYVGISRQQALVIKDHAMHDAAYLIKSVRRLQTHQDVKRIVLLTHTLPDPAFVAHDPDIAGTWRYNSMGNQLVQQVLDQDSEHKIRNWVFGHYHRPVDQTVDDIKYVSNPRGRGDTPWCQTAYYPKKITVEF